MRNLLAPPTRQIGTLPSSRPVLWEGNWVQCKRGLVPVLAVGRVGGASFPGLSVLFETCTQVALNVDFGRARGPESQGRLLDGTHGTAQPSGSHRPCPPVSGSRGWAVSPTASYCSSNAL